MFCGGSEIKALCSFYRTGQPNNVVDFLKAESDIL